MDAILFELQGAGGIKAFIQASLLATASISLASVSWIYTLLIPQWRGITVYKPLRNREAEGGSGTFCRHHLYCHPFFHHLASPLAGTLLCVRRRDNGSPVCVTNAPIVPWATNRNPCVCMTRFLKFGVFSFFWKGCIGGKGTISHSSMQISGTPISIHQGG